MARSSRDPPHARIYSHWLDLPSFRALSTPAVALLVHIVARHRPETNGRLSWSIRKAADAIKSSKDTAARALDELEANGWIAVVSVGRYGCRSRSSMYRLTWFDDIDGGRATKDFMYGSRNTKIGAR